MSRIDLDGKNLPDYGDGTPFLPFESGHYRGKLKSVVFKNEYRGNAYLFEFECFASDNVGVRVGSDFCLRFKVTNADPALPARSPGGI